MAIWRYGGLFCLGGQKYVHVSGGQKATDRGIPSHHTRPLAVDHSLLNDELKCDLSHNSSLVILL